MIKGATRRSTEGTNLGFTTEEGTAMIIAIATIALLIGLLSILAYWLAIYALPFMIGLAVARFAYETGAGPVGAGVAGLLAAVGSMVLLILALAVLKSSLLRLTMVFIFIIPAMIAGYALVNGLTHELVPSAIWRQVFGIAGGILIGLSALARLTAIMETRLT